MKSVFLKILSVVLALGIFPLAGMTALADTSRMNPKGSDSFSLPCFFSTGMLFQQNKEMNIWGKGDSGTTVTASLFHQNSVIETVDTTVESDGNWSLGFSPREGGFEKYAISFYVDGNLVYDISDVLIGELWIGSGQSNMQFFFRNQIGSTEIIEEVTSDERYSNVRILDIGMGGKTSAPDSLGVQYDTYNNSSKKSSWGYGNVKRDIGSVSAYGMLTAYRLFETLDVPIGFINATIGSTSIQAWMSPDAVESDPFIVETLERHNEYSDTWNEKSRAYNQTTGSWNTRLGPVAGMNIAGFLWYQGCSNLEDVSNCVSDPGFYKHALTAFINDLADKFGFDDANDMPFIVAQLAPDNFMFSNTSLPIWVEEVKDSVDRFELAQQIPFYDADTIYRLENATETAPGNGIDHPSDKRTLAKRTAEALLHNYYAIDGYKADYYAPEVESYEIADGKITVTFKNVGDGLNVITGESTETVSRAESNEIEGFTVCGADRIFAPARAKIISKNQIEVANSLINDPEDFTYGFTNMNTNSDLCNSYGIPAIQYRSNRENENDIYAFPFDWATADHTVFWDINRADGRYTENWRVGQLSGITNPDDGTLSVSSDVRIQGQGSVKFSYNASTAQSGLVSAGPNYDSYWFLSNGNLQRYNTLTVFVKNADKRDKKLSLMCNLSNGSVAEIAPADPGLSEYTLLAESDFTCFAFDLSNITSVSDGSKVSKDELANIGCFEFVIGDSAEGTVYFDYIEVGFEQSAQTAERLKVESVINKIEQLGITEVTDQNVERLREAVDNAEDALETFLTEFEDGYVTNLSTLENAEAMLENFSFMYGDIDGDKKITTSDALKVLQATVGKITLTEKQKKAADVDLIEGVSISDALCILQYSVKKIDRFPAER